MHTKADNNKKNHIYLFMYIYIYICCVLAIVYLVVLSTFCFKQLVFFCLLVYFETNK